MHLSVSRYLFNCSFNSYEMPNWSLEPSLPITSRQLISMTVICTNNLSFLCLSLSFIHSFSLFQFYLQVLFFRWRGRKEEKKREYNNRRGIGFVLKTPPSLPGHKLKRKMLVTKAQSLMIYFDNIQISYST